jgi:hypothetical protein
MPTSSSPATEDWLQARVDVCRRFGAMTGSPPARSTRMPAVCGSSCAGPRPPASSSTPSRSATGSGTGSGEPGPTEQRCSFGTEPRPYFGLRRSCAPGYQNSLGPLIPHAGGRPEDLRWQLVRPPGSEEMPHLFRGANFRPSRSHARDGPAPAHRLPPPPPAFAPPGGGRRCAGRPRSETAVRRFTRPLSRLDRSPRGPTPSPPRPLRAPGREPAPRTGSPAPCVAAWQPFRPRSPRR